MEPFVLENNNLVALIEYRLKCLEEGKEGLVIEDGVEYPVTVWGNFVDGKYPKCDDLHCKLLERLIRGQLEKRKVQRKAL